MTWYDSFAVISMTRLDDSAGLLLVHYPDVATSLRLIVFEMVIGGGSEYSGVADGTNLLLSPPLPPNDTRISCSRIIT